MLSNRKPTILIVDDMTTNILLLSDILKDDYSLKIAKSGQKCLEILYNQDNIDLVLLDIEMPDINGYEVCKQLKQADKTKDIPIIFVTAKSSEEDEEYGLNIGAIDYITKPYSKVIIKTRIKNQIKLREKTLMLEKLSMYDGLTNIKNRRFFDEIFEKTYNDVKREKSNLAIMMIDIDFFKPYNDNYGHGKGDETLKRVAITLQKTLHRPNDLVARYGGEEFVVLIKDIDEDGLNNIANNILKAIRELNIEHKFSSIESFLTISIGICFFNSNNNLTKTEILLRADETLYNVKHSGKNNFLITKI
ncbi:GGDEF domain-containing response regulator [Aliarcobacter vitoriensis]|uniref:diguanylate cyclase n=1 Tax=Aliarcobacter vitoriensis TaxID=2011099 RepID=A0A366MNX8_9BACT|nr:diguanylate cyclase [Aliarcobacter vitoriensis]RBQ27991.1 diguanylate cyclase response regulator [Aliarcobacter vitoriensis]